jgi:type IV pilus assembly protein PilV
MRTMRQRYRFDRSASFGRQAGLSLIEILVTLVVVAIGLLGIAGLQVASLKLGLVAENRSNAVVYVNNILDKMRANKADISAYVTAFGAASPTGTTQAEKDLAEVKAQIASNLPSGDIAISVLAGTATSCDAPTLANCWDVRVQMRWDESNVKGGKSGAAQKFVDISSRI